MLCQPTHPCRYSAGLGAGPNVRAAQGSRHVGAHLPYILPAGNCLQGKGRGECGLVDQKTTAYFSGPFLEQDSRLILEATNTQPDTPLLIMTAVVNSFQRANTQGHGRKDMGAVYEALV